MALPEKLDKQVKCPLAHVNDICHPPMKFISMFKECELFWQVLLHSTFDASE
jgi:hypothetical protein